MHTERTKRNPASSIFLLLFLSLQGERRKHTDKHQKVGAEKIRVSQGGKHAPPQKRKPLGIHPSFGIQVSRHASRIGILYKSPDDNADGPRQKDIKRFPLFLLSRKVCRDKHIKKRIRQGQKAPVKNGKEFVRRIRTRIKKNKLKSPRQTIPTCRHN